MTNSRFAKVVMGGLAMWYVTGCETGSDSQIPKEETLFHIYDINSYPLNKVVCDPTGGGGGVTAPKQGVKGELFYRGTGQSRYYRAQDYIDHTTKASVDLFFTDLFVPTRMFDQGFSTQTSGVLKDDSGNKLIEYFGIKMQTNLRLSPEDSEGVYEFALLSDDGSVMKIKNDSGTWQEIISNDGDHPTRLGCSNHRVTMTRDTKLETEILYYQGPRYHISNILLWRKLSETQQAGTDSRCGATGNSLWFDPNNSSQPTQEFSQLIVRGWNVVSPGNFYLPDQQDETTQFNPCTTGTNPQISNFRVTEVANSTVFLAWNTDIPATAQVLVIEVDTGNSRLTATDNALRTSHSIQVSGLNSGTRYTFQAVNVSEDLGRAVGSPIEITTP